MNTLIDVAIRALEVKASLYGVTKHLFLIIYP